MILLRSIRRRLVTGFTVALVLFLIMAGLAIWGLVRHQSAISNLQDVVHHSPRKERLVEAVTLIQLPLAQADRLDLSQDAAISMIETQFRERIAKARREAADFFARCEEEERKTKRRIYGRQKLLMGCQKAVNDHLDMLETTLAPRIRCFDTTSAHGRIHKLNQTQLEASQQIAAIINNLTDERLPSYEKENFVEAELNRENNQSERRLRQTVILIVIALATYAITLFFGFRWVSMPLRAIARGASRIANGDTDYRLGKVSRWNDEFADVTENFNRMADKFQQSEDHLNAKVEERSRALVRSERLAGVGFLAAGLAHEINSPLQAMRMGAESAQFRLYDHVDLDNEDVKEAMERLSMIQREAQRCGEITRRMLDFARSEKQEKQPNDLVQVIGEVLAMIRPMSKYDDRKIVFERTKGLIVEMNAGQMKQVILNLVANALQATGPGGRVEIAIEEQADWVLVRVIDDGDGMLKEQMEQLFEPFFTTKETGQGTGLGLSITHRIIEDHKGTIDPQSEGRGKGSTFVIRLPRRQPQAAAQRTVA